jgi:hypothetical protein
VTGFTGVTLGLYLGAAGVGALDAGLVIGAGLAGLALTTALVASRGRPSNARATLVITTLLSAAGLAALTLSARPGPLAVAAFLGLVNGMGRDRGPAQTVEQAVLADHVAAADRTRLFTRYTLAQDVAGALGSWAAALPTLLHGMLSLSILGAHRVTFLGAAVVAALPAWLYAGLPREHDGVAASFRSKASVETRKRVGSLAALFALDSVGGGFLAGSVLSYWFFQRFGLTGAVLGPLFFATRVLNALSYLVAERLARRIGLLSTMVFTHLPSSVILLLLPFAPTAWAAAAILLVREALVQMDVPTRTSYVAAVTPPGDRTFALGVTGLVRNIGWATGPAGAGWAMQTLGLGAPLVAGAGLKIVYDVLLYRGFRHIRPPEELAGRSGAR